MGKFDTSKRIQRGIQPGLAPIAPNMGLNPSGNPSMGMPFNDGSDMKLHGGLMMGANPPTNNNLLSPSFESVMNKNPNQSNAINKRAIGTRQSLMNKLDSGY